MQPWMRASDADRERVVAALQVHTAAGRLSLDEFAARVDAANHAIWIGDLIPLTADLPIPADRPASLRMSAALALGAIVLAVLLLAALIAGIASWTRTGPMMR